MIEEYDWDTYEILKEQLDIQLEHVEAYILSLDKKELRIDAIDELFRFFHTFKASSIYLELTPMYEVFNKAESVLSILRENPQVLNDSIIEWLLIVEDQINKYSLEMDKKETLLSPINKKILNGLKLNDTYMQPQERLKTLPIIYVDPQQVRAKKVLPALKKYSDTVTYTQVLDDKSNLKIDEYKIIVCYIDSKDFSLIDFIKLEYPHIPVVPIFSSIDFLDAKDLLNKGISHFVNAPLSMTKLQTVLLSIVKIFYSSANIIIDHKKINDFIQNIQPLSNTIVLIMQICDDEEIPVKELIKTVKTDPVISANILKVANCPMYGSTEIRTIDQAVTKFGKKAIKSLAMSGAYKSIGTIDLSPYGIDEGTFSEVSMKRLALMIKWYAKVSVADLSFLSTTALLGNLGQLLISKELIDMDKVEEFEELEKAFGTHYAEEKLLHTNTNSISSQILRYWKLSSEIVDIIENSDKPNDAPQEIKKLSAAHHIVNALITIKGEISDEIPDTLLPLLAEFNLDPTPLTKALNNFKTI